MADQGYFNYSQAITPSDTVNVPLVGGTRLLCDAIYVGGAGTVTVVKENGETQQYTAVAGEILPVSAKRVNATGTAATLMVAMYTI